MRSIWALVASLGRHSLKSAHRPTKQQHFSIRHNIGITCCAFYVRACAVVHNTLLSVCIHLLPTTHTYTHKTLHHCSTQTHTLTTQTLTGASTYISLNNSRIQRREQLARNGLRSRALCYYRSATRRNRMRRFRSVYPNEVRDATAFSSLIQQHRACVARRAIPSGHHRQPDDGRANVGQLN